MGKELSNVELLGFDKLELRPLFSHFQGTL